MAPSTTSTPLQWHLQSSKWFVALEKPRRVLRKSTESTAGSIGFLSLLFFSLFSIPTFPYVQKSRTTQKKNNPLRRIWSKSIPDFFGFFVFLEVFGCPSVFPFFARFFGVPSPNCPKNWGKRKKTKETILWEESVVSLFQIVFLFCSSRGFLVSPAPIVQKVQENQKKTILWEESGVSPFQIVFLCFWFFSRFLLSQIPFFHTLMLPISLSTCRQKFGDDLGFFTCPSCLCGFGQWNALWNTLELCSSGHSKTKCFLLPRNGASADS